METLFFPMLQYIHCSMRRSEGQSCNQRMSASHWQPTEFLSARCMTRFLSKRTTHLSGSAAAAIKIVGIGGGQINDTGARRKVDQQQGLLLHDAVRASKRGAKDGGDSK